MPSYDSAEGVGRGEFVLGGCFVSVNDSDRRCKSCGQDFVFSGDSLLYLFELTSFKLFVGGCFGTSKFIFIDGKRKNKVIRYAETPGGMSVDLKHPKNEINLYPDIILREIPLTEELWNDFIKEITALEIASWKDKYYDNDICDGTQWDIMIRFSNCIKINKYGSNDYPTYWSKLVKVIKKYIGETIS